MTVTLQRQIMCRASSSPQGIVHSLRQLLLLLQQLRSSGGRPSGDQRHNPQPQAGPHSPLEGVGQKPQVDMLPEPPRGFSYSELEVEERVKKTG